MIRVLEDNHDLTEVVKNYNLSPKEFIQIPAADGETQLNAWIMKPINFDPAQKYPVLITQYSGPNSQQVKNAWGGVNWLNYLALHIGTFPELFTPGCCAPWVDADNDITFLCQIIQPVDTAPGIFYTRCIQHRHCHCSRYQFQVLRFHLHGTIYAYAPGK